MKKETKNESSKERILKAAKVIFARKGFADTGMRELADAAEVNLAMINYFFGNKKELLKIILDDFFAGYIDILETELLRDLPLEEKIEKFIHRAVDYLTDNRESMIITMTELPHDDPDIIEHKAVWARKAMDAIHQGVIIPIKETSGVDISPAAIGPLFIGMMSSRFLFAPVMEQLQPPGYGQEFFKEYPDIISTIFIRGIKGLITKKEARND